MVVLEDGSSQQRISTMARRYCYLSVFLLALAHLGIHEPAWLCFAFQAADQSASRPTYRPRRFVPVASPFLSDAKIARRESETLSVVSTHTTPLLLASLDDGEKEATSKAAETNSSPAVGGSDLDDDEVSSSSVTRTLLLAVPLFCKFVLVLMIKFVTDLIVYPLLLLYRIARIAKRKVLRMFQGSSKSINGETSK
jgi:hypothetical protein